MNQKRIAFGLAAFVALLLSLFGPVSAHAQVSGGTIQGTMTDESGAVIPNGQVAIKNVATGVVRTTTTNASGFYNAPNLLPGQYEIRASASGFSTEVRSGITLTVGSEQVVNLQVRVGQVTQTVEITGAAPAVDLASSTLSHVVEAQTIRELPLNGRDWTQLATLQPGVNRVWSQDTADFNHAQRGNGVQLTIAGGRPSENNYRLNAVSINDYANTAPGSSLGLNLGVDAIQEFSVLTNTYSAEYGRTSGGVVNAVSKSGTNSIHGSTYYFHRNSALDARNFFDRTPDPPPFRRHQFGGSLGGPIKKDRTFWFADFEALRESLGITKTSFVPSTAARAGQLCSVPSGCTPSTVTVDSAVKPFLAIYPFPNGGLLKGGDTGIFSIAGQRVSHENFVTGRMDHRFSEKDSINGMYLFDKGSVSSPDEFNNKDFSNPSQRHVATLEETHMFSATMLNSARLGFARTFASNGYATEVLNPLLKDPSLGFIPGIGIGTVSVTGLSFFSGGLGRLDGNTFFYTSYQLYDDFNWTRGIHSIKLGLAVERMWNNFDAADGGNGKATFNSLSDLLVNKPFQLQALLPNSDTIRGVRETLAAGYVQDDVRLRRNLTLNLGLRYEMTSVPREVNGKEASLKNLTDAQPTVGPVFENPTLRNFAPRVGFAWDPFGDGKTSIRSAFGIFDVLPLPYTLVNQINRTPPFYRAGIATPPVGSFPTQMINFLGPTTLRTVYIDPKPARAYKMQWNLNIQRQITNSLSASLGYVGTRGLHLPWRNNNLDTVIATKTDHGYIFPPSSTSVKINPGFGVIRGAVWNADSYYHALQFNVVKKLSHGLQAQGSYTWSKSIDSASTVFSSNELTNTVNIPIPWDSKVNRGPSDFDVRHNFVLNFLWNIPTPGTWTGAASSLLGGWQLGSIYQANSGTPFTMTISGDVAGSKMGGDASQRPILVNSPECHNLTNPGSLDYVKTQCFIPPVAGIINNIVGRNSLTGPGLSNLDFSLFKNNHVKKISENFNIQFRVELFNALNRSNLFSPNDNRAVFDSGGRLVTGAGRITTTQTPSRQIQFGLKFIW